MPPPDSDDGVAVTEVSFLEEQAACAPRPMADLEHPWLGLESFREETRAYFFGRDVETAELHLRLRSQPLLVLQWLWKDKHTECRPHSATAQRGLSRRNPSAQLRARRS